MPRPPIVFGPISVIVKVVDFGLSTVPAKCARWESYPEIQRMGVVKDFDSVMGTRATFAPELIRAGARGFSPLILSQGEEEHLRCAPDVWGLGIIFFVLLHGKSPFTGAENVSLFRSILIGFRGISNEDWKSFSDVAKEMVRCMLDPEPASRISAQDLSRSLARNWNHMRGEVILTATQERFKEQQLKYQSSGGDDRLKGNVARPIPKVGTRQGLFL